MPVEYEAVDDDSKLYPIPSGKTVKFYFFQDIDEDQPLNPILTITETTRDKESRIFGTVPVGLNGKECYLLAVVVLKGDFGLEGKTQADIEEAVKNKSILFGQISDEQDPTGWKRYTLNPDLPPIEDFEFVGLATGKPLPSKITFVIPEKYYSMDGSASSPIPGGYPIDFYFTLESDTEPFDPNAIVISGTTPAGGGPVVCELPVELDGEQRYIHAIIRLKGSFEFRGKDKDDLKEAIESKSIIYGHIMDGNLVTLEKNGMVGNFIFFGNL